MDGFAALLVASIVILSLVAVIWALFSVIGTPKEKWELAGKSKTLWIVLLIGGLLLGIGVIVSLIYLLFVAPKVRSPDYRKGYTTHGVGASSIADLPPDDPRRKASGL